MCQDEDDQCLRSPGLLHQLCLHFPSKALASENLDLEVVKAVLKTKKAIHVDAIYVIRDPRAMLLAKLNDKLSGNSVKLKKLQFSTMTFEAEQLCRVLKDDLAVIDHKLPKFNFFTLRYGLSM